MQKLGIFFVFVYTSVFVLFINFILKVKLSFFMKLKTELTINTENTFSLGIILLGLTICNSFSKKRKFLLLCKIIKLSLFKKNVKFLHKDKKDR